MEALECPAEKFVLVKEGRGDPLKVFDLVSNLIRAYDFFFFLRFM